MWCYEYKYDHSCIQPYIYINYACIYNTLFIATYIFKYITYLSINMKTIKGNKETDAYSEKRIAKLGPA